MPGCAPAPAQISAQDVQVRLLPQRSIPLLIPKPPRLGFSRSMMYLVAGILALEHALTLVLEVVTTPAAWIVSASAQVAVLRPADTIVRKPARGRAARSAHKSAQGIASGLALIPVLENQLLYQSPIVPVSLC